VELRDRPGVSRPARARPGSRAAARRPAARRLNDALSRRAEDQPDTAGSEAGAAAATHEGRRGGGDARCVYESREQWEKCEKLLPLHDRLASRKAPVCWDRCWLDRASSTRPTVCCCRTPRAVWPNSTRPRRPWTRPCARPPGPSWISSAPARPPVSTIRDTIRPTRRLKVR
jgi:hypothetical protein